MCIFFFVHVCFLGYFKNLNAQIARNQTVYLVCYGLMQHWLCFHVRHNNSWSIVTFVLVKVVWCVLTTCAFLFSVFSVFLWTCFLNAQITHNQSVYRQLKARRALSLFKDVLLRTRRALLPRTLYSDSTLLVLNRTSLNIDSALLALNWRYMPVMSIFNTGRGFKLPVISLGASATLVLVTVM